ncbi:MAG TPA: hypothetical protein VGK58_14490 [Lacipirellulaceae bacterium]
MTADEARELFSAALDDELMPEEKQRFAAALERDVGLCAEYREFVACNAALRQVAAAGPTPVPDLLPGVQARLRARSRGRFYADRFAERSGTRWSPTIVFALLMLAILALCWLGFHWVDASVQVTQTPPD